MTKTQAQSVKKVVAAGGPAYVLHFRIASRGGLKCEGSSREGAIIKHTVWLFLALIPAAAGAQDAADPSTPWATVNGSADGYSIKLESASSTPGTPLTVGQSVEFKIRVSYQLSIADSGVVVLVVQDEANKNLLGVRKQQSQPATRGHGELTLIENVVVPSGSKEVRLFVPIVPDGITRTSGELMIRYPVANAGAESALGYPTVAAALADLHSKPDVKFSIQNGWTIAEDRANSNFWSFPPEGDPAYPSAVKRTLLKRAMALIWT